MLREKISDEILSRIKPPLAIESFEQVEVMLNDPDCLTLCLRSSYLFLKQRLQSILRDNIAGDIVLAGVWRGGLAIYLQSLLIEFEALDRHLYLADTFSGFPPVDERYPKDRKMREYFSTLKAPSGSEHEITTLMSKWNMPLDNVRFLTGDVANTTRAFKGKVSLLLIDVDFYAPTWSALVNLYDSLSPGGTVYVDDYGVEQYECKEAVDNFLSLLRSPSKIEKVNEFAVSWRK